MNKQDELEKRIKELEKEVEELKARPPIVITIPQGQSHIPPIAWPYSPWPTKTICQQQAESIVSISTSWFNA